jgi:hypothetical protein
MESRLQLVAILVSGGLLLLVLELVRQRRVMERYALLWLLSATVLFGMAVWKALLLKFADAIGIVYAPSALFVVALGFILMLLLHFSTVISGLTDQNKVLAQQLALLRERITAMEHRQGGEEPEAEPDRAAREEPVGASELRRSR